MSGYIILLLLLIVGMVILAHEMGKQVGVEREMYRGREREVMSLKLEIGKLLKN